MSIIYLIRHGQASFGGDNYDILSPLGEMQARLIGERLRQPPEPLAVAYSGALRRQIDTARLALGGGDCIADPAFDEYSAAALFRRYAPAAPLDELRRDPRRFQENLSAVADAWLADDSPDNERGGVESWQAFRARVRAGLTSVARGLGKDEAAAVFTSGGVIGAAVGEALGLTGRRAVSLSWRVLNASVTELSFGRSGFALLGFNDVGHLRRAGPGLLTYR